MDYFGYRFVPFGHTRAENFSTNYLDHAQIFIAPHSFNFLSLDGDNISKYRVYKDEDEQNSKIIQITKANEKHIQEDIGLLIINDQLASLYTRLETELSIVGNGWTITTITDRTTASAICHQQNMPLYPLLKATNRRVRVFRFRLI